MGYKALNDSVPVLFPNLISHCSPCCGYAVLLMFLQTYDAHSSMLLGLPSHPFLSLPLPFLFHYSLLSNVYLSFKTQPPLSSCRNSSTNHHLSLSSRDYLRVLHRILQFTATQDCDHLSASLPTRLGAPDDIPRRGPDT